MIAFTFFRAIGAVGVDQVLPLWYSYRWSAMPLHEIVIHN
jgi:hypothetical protein